MSTIWSRTYGYARSCLSWFNGSERFVGQIVQGGFGEVQGNGVLAVARREIPESRVKHRKLILAGALLVPVFVGWFMGLDPEKLAGIVGVIFGPFVLGDALNDYTYRKFTNGNDSSLSSPSSSGG